MCCNYLDGETWREEHGGDRKSGQRTNECLPYFSPTLTTIIRHKLCVYGAETSQLGENIHAFSLLLPWFVYFVLSKRRCQCCVATTQQRLCEKSCTVQNNMEKQGVRTWFAFHINSRHHRLCLSDPYTDWVTLCWITSKTDLFFFLYSVRLSNYGQRDSHHFYMTFTF